MRNFSSHERRWASDTVPSRGVSVPSSPATSEALSSEEFVEVTLDFQDDDTVILRSVEPAVAPTACFDIEADTADRRGPPSESASVASTSPSIGRSSSHGRLRQFSQELKAEAVAKAKQLSQELKAELRKFSWSHGHGSKAAGSSLAASAGIASAVPLDSALAARALRKQLAQQDRARSGAHKALRGLRFISSGKTNNVDAWNEVQANFDRLAKDGCLSRSDFAQCIGKRTTEKLHLDKEVTRIVYRFSWISGMKETKEFALELFDALKRRRRLGGDKITKEELHEFWSQITEQSFDSRLQIFFDMYGNDSSDRMNQAVEPFSHSCLTPQTSPSVPHLPRVSHRQIHLLPCLQGGQELGRPDHRGGG